MRVTMEGAQGERGRDEMLQGYQWLTVPPYRTLGRTSKKELLSLFQALSVTLAGMLCSYTCTLTNASSLTVRDRGKHAREDGRVQNKEEGESQERRQDVEGWGEKDGKQETENEREQHLQYLLRSIALQLLYYIEHLLCLWINRLLDLANYKKDLANSWFYIWTNTMLVCLILHKNCKYSFPNCRINRPLKPLIIHSHQMID